MDKNSGKIEYDKENVIGRGGISIVYGGTFEFRPVIAVKRIERRHCNDREIEAQLKLYHKNVVKMLTVEEENTDYRYMSAFSLGFVT